MLEPQQRRQALLADFSLLVLRAPMLQAVLDHACRMAAEGLEVRFARILERRPGTEELAWCAGVGWRHGSLVSASIGGDIASPASHAFRTGEVVVSGDLAAETRFRTPALLAEHGIRSNLSVIIPGARGPFGVLEVGSPDEDAFGQENVAFLRVLANTLGLAIEQCRSRQREAVADPDQALPGRARHQSQESFEAALAAAEMGSWDLDVDRNMTRRSLLHDRIYGYPELLPAWPAGTCMRHVIPEDRDAVDAAYAAAGPTGAVDYACRIRRIDGALRWIAVKGRVLYDEAGRPTRMVGVTRDVTDRKLAEAAVRESEARFRTLVEAVPHLVWATGPDGNLNWQNGRMLAYSGLPAEAIHGGGWQRILHPEDQLRSIQAWEGVLATGQVYEIEHRLRRHDGEHRWFLSRAVPQRDEGGRIVQWIGTSTDIEDHKRVASALHTALEKDRRLGELDLLIREMHHRVTNSLQLVSGMLAMQLQATTDPAARAAIREAESRVLTVARVHHRLHHGHALGTVDFQGYLEELCADLAASAGSRVEVRATPAEIPADEAVLLGIAAAELVTNALKHAASAKGTVEVCFSADQDGRRLVVADDGPGLPAGFDPATAKGLGVRIVMAITRKLRGRLEHERSPAGGARFSLTLPP